MFSPKLVGLCHRSTRTFARRVTITPAWVRMVTTAYSGRLNGNFNNRAGVASLSKPTGPCSDLSLNTEEPYWRKIPSFKDVSISQFLSHKWQMSNTVQSEKALCEFLMTVLPEEIPPQRDMEPHLRISDIHTPQEFIQHVTDGIKKAPMAIRLSPHILSVIDWNDPINDPVRRQFIPLSSPLNVDHPMAVLDPMHENEYSPVSGLIHRYPDRALFFGKLCYDTQSSWPD